MASYAAVSHLQSELPAARIGASGASWSSDEALALLREESARIQGRLVGAGIAADAEAVVPLYDHQTDPDPSDADLTGAQLLLRRICRMAAAARIYYSLPTDTSYERAQDLERESRLSLERFIAEPGSLGVRSSIQILTLSTETT